MVDEFGDRMKSLERVYTDTRIGREIPFLAVRLDGKNFSKYTKQFLKPFDQRMTDAVRETTEFLVKETNANVGYAQSDEITMLYSLSEKSDGYMFGGKISKINSVFASMATAKFNSVIPSDKLAFFDCRVWAVDTKAEASNVVLWRFQDCRKNATSALFRWTAGAKRMHGLNQKQMQDILDKEYDNKWKNLTNQYKFGTVVKPVLIEKEDVLRKRYDCFSVDIGNMDFGDRMVLVSKVERT